MSGPRKLKIAFIHPDLGIGGAERLVLDIAVALKSSGHQVRFLTNHYDPSHAFDELKTGEFPVEVYGDWLPRSICGRFQAFCAYIRMIYLSITYLLFYKNEHKPDVYFTDLIPVANAFLRLFNEKVVYYCHHPDLLASAPGGRLKKLYRMPINWLEMYTTGLAGVILVNSQYTASVFRATFPTLENDIQILYPTIADSYQKTVSRLKKPKSIEGLLPEINKPGKKIVFLSINRYHPAKKLEFAVLALDKLRQLISKEDWDITYLILAGGYDPQSGVNAITYLDLVNLTKDKKLENKIVFLKSPNDNLKAELLNSCTCLVYTPVNEHFGIVPLEAMMVSKPVIAVNSGGPRETVNHGVTGYLCEPNPESMAEFMARIVTGNSEEMGIKGKCWLEEQFSYDNFKKSLLKLLDKLCTDPSNKKD